MKLEERKNAFIKLGICLTAYLTKDKPTVDMLAGKGSFSQLSNAIEQAATINTWFTSNNIEQAITAVSSDMLKPTLLNSWLQLYPNIENNKLVKSVGIVMAGNLPLVGFHDMLCVLICGYNAIIKPSSKDSVLIKAIALILCKIEPRFEKHIYFTDNQPTNIDCIIATGSNNTARYFESWYKNIPSIIRKNRNSVAVLTGDETDDELTLLGDDIFNYFGLGCRNVSSLFVPENYSFERLFHALKKYASIIKNKGYNDCYRYQKAIMTIDEADFFDTGFLLLKNSMSLSAPIALVNYQKYITLEFVNKLLTSWQHKIQCIVYQNNNIPNSIKFGQTQHPQLYDYADGIDTLNFLLQQK